MTQYDEKVQARKLQLEEEAKDKQVIGIDTRIKDGKWTEQITTYASGRTVTEYADKRKKIVEEG
jgi:hypothetical protein|tara:strand:- start:247 stop:438 length:192 start_codon:yes stop_codon:yes gene_type:complete